MLFARGIEVCQSLKLGVFVGCNVDAFAIFAKLAATISDLCATLWSDKGFLAVARFYNPQIALVRRNFLAYKNLAIIRRPIERLPSSALKLCEHAIALGIRPLNHVPINLLSISPRRSLTEFLPVLLPYPRHLPRSAIRDQSHVTPVVV